MIPETPGCLAMFSMTQFLQSDRIRLCWSWASIHSSPAAGGGKGVKGGVGSNVAQVLATFSAREAQ